MTGDGLFHQIDRVNQHRNAGEFVLYTPRFGSRTDPDASGVEVVLSGVPLPLGANLNVTATVVAVRPATGGSPSTVHRDRDRAQHLVPVELLVGGPVQLTLSITSGLGKA